jgi:sorting nexin-8
VSLVSTRPRVSKLEFFVALALVALAQSGKGQSISVQLPVIRSSIWCKLFADISIEQVAALSSQNTLPEPSLNLDALQPSTSSFAPANVKSIPVRSPAPAYSADDPWNTATRFPAVGTGPSVPGGVVSSLSGTGLPKDWWRRQEHASVTILGQQGFILNRYTVYEIASEVRVALLLCVVYLCLLVQRGAPVPRRYSEFVFLWDCLVRRYPFRLLPALPPKRIGRESHGQCTGSIFDAFLQRMKHFWNNEGSSCLCSQF